MSISSIKAGEAWWEITARDKATAVIDKIAKRLASVGKRTIIAGAAVQAAGAAIVAPMLLAAKSVSDYADGLVDATVKTGFSVEALSSLKFAAEEQGASLDQLLTGLKGMAKLTLQVASGNKQAVSTLAALGITAEKFLALSPEDRFAALAEQISKIADPQERAGVAMKVFGKSAQDLLPLIALGADGIARLRARSEELGLTLSTEAATAVKDFSDEVHAMSQQVKRAWQEIGVAVIEVLKPWIETIHVVLRGIIEFVKRNHVLVLSVLAVGVAIIAAGAAITALGFALMALSAVMTAASAIVAFLGSSFLLTVAAIGAAIAGIVIAVGAVALAFVQLTDIGGAMASTIGHAFSTAWGGIIDSLLTGNLELAGMIAFQGLATAWTSMIFAMEDAWWNFLKWFAQLAPMTAGMMGITTEGMTANVEANRKALADQVRALEMLRKAAAADREKAMKKFAIAGGKEFGAPDLSKLKAVKSPAESGLVEAGTFSATVAGMLGRTWVAELERIANANEKANDQLDEIKDAIEANAPEWE